MIARFTGGILGLLAFGVAMVAGLVVGNPPEIILGRALWALALLCVVGMAVGAAGQAVINEYMAKKTKTAFPPDKDAVEATGAAAATDNSTSSAPKPMGTE
jgi:hypothetical protein